MKEIDKNIKALLEELKGKDKIEANQCTRMFNLNNALFPELAEWTPSCGACRERVYNRLLRYAENIK